MDERGDLRLFALDERARFVVVKDFAPGFFEARHLGALTLAHLGQAVGEVTVGEHRYLGSAFDEVHDGGFHARRAGARDGDGAFVLGAENVAQQVGGVLQDAEEIRVRVADDRRGQRRIDTRVDHARAGAQKDAVRWLVEGGHDWKRRPRRRIQRRKAGIIA